MAWYQRENGISVLVACQNEEATLALCILSFLEFADEIIEPMVVGLDDIEVDAGNQLLALAADQVPGLLPVAVRAIVLQFLNQIPAQGVDSDLVPR